MHPDFDENGQHFKSGYYWGPNALSIDLFIGNGYSDPVISLYWCMREVHAHVFGQHDVVKSIRQAFGFKHHPSNKTKIPLDKLLIP